MPRVTLLEQGPNLAAGVVLRKRGLGFPEPRSAPIPGPGVLRKALPLVDQPRQSTLYRSRALQPRLGCGGCWRFYRACDVEPDFRRSFALKRELSMASRDCYEAAGATPGSQASTSVTRATRLAPRLARARLGWAKIGGGSRPGSEELGGRRPVALGRGARVASSPRLLSAAARRWCRSTADDAHLSPRSPSSANWEPTSSAAGRRDPLSRRRGDSHGVARRTGADGSRPTRGESSVPTRSILAAGSWNARG